MQQEPAEAEKQLLTCGLLQVLVNRGIKTVSFKCGPDYIDPMFHTQVIGTKSRNLDTFFTGEEITRYLLAKNSADCEIAVMEGVMGFYDGVAGITTRASAYDLARVNGHTCNSDREQQRNECFTCCLHKRIYGV